MAEIAGAICQLPNPILIGGHTDRRLFPSGSTYTNWELSTDRANAARRILEADCVRPESIRRIVGYADTEPLVPEDPFAPANRRISITVLRINGAETPPATQGQAPSISSSKDNLRPPAVEPSDSARDSDVSPAENSPENTKLSPGNSVPAEKLRTEGSVGDTPDKLPAGIPRSKEKKPPSTLNP